MIKKFEITKETPLLSLLGADECRGHNWISWLASQVAKGDDGKSAYQLAQEAGYTGTEQELAEALERVPEMATKDEIADVVRFSAQDLTDVQKAQARANIGAVGLTPELEELHAYGIEWDTEVANSACTRIGNANLHRTLPIQSQMCGCLLDDDGNVVEYLPSDSWLNSTRDGSKGQVMVEIPHHYRRFEMEGTKRRCKLSAYPIDGYHYVQKRYISAYEATVERDTNKLCSVVNTGANYRGGDNNSAWDGTYRTLLGRPATVISRTNFRKYARNRNGAATAEWNCQAYEAYKALFWLYVVEYANSNCQLAFNAEKDANGYARGGLGNGVTTMKDADWSSYFSYYPFVPCGHTDELGNGSGEVAYEVPKDDGTVLATVYANRYRGVENPFGHIWKWIDGINIKISPTEENGGDNTSKVFVADDPANYNDSNYDGYSMRGLEARENGYVKELIFGEFGDIMPAAVGGGSTTYYADYHYTDIPTKEALRGVLFGGYALHGAFAGFGFARSNAPSSYTAASFGSRLCFIPTNE